MKWFVRINERLIECPNVFDAVRLFAMGYPIMMDCSKDEQVVAAMAGS